MRARDLTGEIFTRLTVIQNNGKDKHGHYLWLCNCSCGNQKVCNTSDLLSGNTKSCGCFRKENTAIIGKENITHGLTNEPGYRSWRHMVDRCTNSSHPYFHHYGGRGIKVCDNWLKSPNAFLQDMGPKPSENHSIDRYPNNNGNYEPSNCRWATPAEQSKNTRRNIIVEYKEKSYVLIDLANELNIHYNSLRYFLLEKNQSIDEAISNSRSIAPKDVVANYKQS